MLCFTGNLLVDWVNSNTHCNNLSTSTLSLIDGELYYCQLIKPQFYTHHSLMSQTKAKASRRFLTSRVDKVRQFTNKKTCVISVTLIGVQNF